MFFAVSKLLGFAVIPSNLLLLPGAIGLGLLLVQRRRAATAWLTASVALLMLFGWSPLGNVLLLPLTERFPAWQSGDRAPDGIIVLGGAIDAEASVARGALEVNGAGERLIAMLQLARRYPEARLVFSGGSGNLFLNPIAEAPLAAKLLQDFDVSGQRLLFESQSRNTAENAAFTRDLVKPKPGERWLLVTSAFHMPRAMGLFRHAGFDVEAYPVDWRTRGWIDATVPFDRVSSGLARCDIALHEWVGLLIGWLRGDSSELWPGPRPE